MKKISSLFFALTLISSVSVFAQTDRYEVVMAEISQEDFESAWMDRQLYNVHQEPVISGKVKKKITDSVTRYFQANEPDWFRGEECFFSVPNIWKLPDNHYMVEYEDIMSKGIVFIGRKNKVISRIDQGEYYALSGGGLFAGIPHFDCDPYAHLLFYSVSPDYDCPQIISEYLSQTWSVQGHFEELHGENLFWFEGSLYCAGVSINRQDMAPIYCKLSLVNH